MGNIWIKSTNGYKLFLMRLIKISSIKNGQVDFVLDYIPTFLKLIVSTNQTTLWFACQEKLYFFKFVSGLISRLDMKKEIVENLNHRCYSYAHMYLDVMYSLEWKLLWHISKKFCTNAKCLSLSAKIEMRKHF